MMSSRSASRFSSASAAGHEEQPWLVYSSTTAFGADCGHGGRGRGIGALRLGQTGKTGQAGCKRYERNECAWAVNILLFGQCVRLTQWNIGISPIKCESRMGETTCPDFASVRSK